MAEIRPSRHLSKSGKTVFIRTAYGKDAAKVLACAQQIIAERKYSMTSPEEFLVGLEQEIELLESYRKDPGRLFIIAETEDREIVGTLDFAPGSFIRQRHWGEFGMGVLASCRGEGIGSVLLQALLSWASGHDRIEKICLSVHADNPAAIELYKKFGFEIEGIRRKETRFEPDQFGPDRYVDTVLMAKFLDHSE